MVTLPGSRAASARSASRLLSRSAMRLPLVVLPLAGGHGDLDLGVAVGEVDRQRDQCGAGGGQLALDPGDLLAVEQQLAGAPGRVVGPGAVAVLGNVRRTAATPRRRRRWRRRRSGWPDPRAATSPRCRSARCPPRRCRGCGSRAEPCGSARRTCGPSPSPWPLSSPSCAGPPARAAACVGSHVYPGIRHCTRAAGQDGVFAHRVYEGRAQESGHGLAFIGTRVARQPGRPRVRCSGAPSGSTQRSARRGSNPAASSHSSSRFAEATSLRFAARSASRVALVAPNGSPRLPMPGRTSSNRSELQPLPHRAWRVGTLRASSGTIAPIVMRLR